METRIGYGLDAYSWHFIGFPAEMNMLGAWICLHQAWVTSMMNASFSVHGGFDRELRARNLRYSWRGRPLKIVLVCSFVAFDLYYPSICFQIVGEASDDHQSLRGA